VLVLSEFAGAADDLSDALIVNPYDVAGMAEAMHRSLGMDASERRRRMQAMRAHVLERDVHAWAAAFLDSLSSAAVGVHSTDPGASVPA